MSEYLLRAKIRKQGIKHIFLYKSAIWLFGRHQKLFVGVFLAFFVLGFALVRNPYLLEEWVGRVSTIYWMAFLVYGSIVALDRATILLQVQYLKARYPYVTKFRFNQIMTDLGYGWAIV